MLTKNGLDETASGAKIACWEQKAIRVTGAADCPAVELESLEKHSAVGLNYEYVASTGIC